jgi:NAD(P)-dependent dehydrogenase (short-subunit alcohol dehydrogenase family)
MVSSYPFSKFLLYMFLRELTNRTPVTKSGVIVNFVSPGICSTELDRNAHGPVGRQVKMARMIMGRTAEMGSRTLLHGLAAGSESHGKVLSECEIKE